MNKTLWFFIIIFTFFSFNVNAKPIENNYGIVNAWYNGEEATVKNVSLKIGEPAEIKVEVMSKIDGNVFVLLNTPLKTVAYEVVSGSSQIDEYIDNLNIKSDWTETYIWYIKPTGEWTNGNAPVNLYVQFNKDYDDVERVEFTIANPIILDEQYIGPGLTHTADQSSHDNSTSQGSPGFCLIFTMICTGLAMRWKQIKI